MEKEQEGISRRSFIKGASACSLLGVAGIVGIEGVVSKMCEDKSLNEQINETPIELKAKNLDSGDRTDKKVIKLNWENPIPLGEEEVWDIRVLPISEIRQGGQGEATFTTWTREREETGDYIYELERGKVCGETGPFTFAIIVQRAKINFDENGKEVFDGWIGPESNSFMIESWDLPNEKIEHSGSSPKSPNIPEDPKPPAPPPPPPPPTF